ncbi:putative pentatricopeptide repeat-containing protein [Quercus suber]|uniref:Pentatricopeptide repeat-containing protein n=1 Tax=Quercus suber TaxID=58331 RepID=A0AAW0L674_QUESU
MKPVKVKPISPFRLSSLLRLQKDPNLALHLFQNPNSNSNSNSNTNPTKAKPFRYTLVSYDLIITKLGRAKMFDEMERILDQLKHETRFSPTEIIFCNVISFYARARLPDRAVLTFFRMPDFRCHRTVKSLNSLLNGLCNCGEFRKLREMFLGFHKYGTPDACTYNILIKACCRSGRLEDARYVFDEMQRRGVCPSVVTFGTLIHQLCLNFRLEEAFKLKNDMMRVYGVMPNAFVYTSLIKGVCGIGELSLAFKLKEEMVRNKLKLNSTVLCHEVNLELLLSVLDSLGKGNFIVVDTWKMAVDMVCKKNMLSNSSDIIDTLKSLIEMGPYCPGKSDLDDHKVKVHADDLIFLDCTSNLTVGIFLNHHLSKVDPSVDVIDKYTV